jgi:uncharacterized protein YpmS
MRHYPRIIFSLLGSSLLALSALACNMPGFQLGGPQPPPQTVQPSGEALASFNDKWRTLNFATPDGPFSITFTNEELTSVVAEAIAQTEADTGETIPIQDIQVIMGDGVVNIYGRVNVSGFEANGLIVVVPSIGADGRLHAEIASIQYGPLQLDPSVLDQVMASVEQSINSPIQSSPFNITLSDVTVTNGQMTINGTITP